MDNNRSLTGFRVLFEVNRDDEVQMKCFIFLNLTKMKCIKDVEEHVKSILDMKAVSLYVKDAWLPSNETVHIIREDDTVIAKTVSNARMILPDDKKSDVGEEEECIKRKRKKKDHQGEPTNVSLELLYKELYDKRKELLKGSDETITNELIATETNDFHCDSLSVLSPAIKKKRIRKHKKKLVKKGELQMEESTSSSNQQYSGKKMKAPFGGKHTRFSDETFNNSAHLSEQDIQFKNMETTEIPIEPQGELSEKSLNEDITPEATNSISHINDKLENSIIEKKLDEAVSTDLSKFNEEESNMEVIENRNHQKVDDVPPSNNETSAIENQECLEEDDWKTKLLSLAMNKDVESKVFHRKIPTQDME